KAGIEEPADPTAGHGPEDPPTTGREEHSKEEALRRLRPHSRGSQLRLDEMAARPQSLTPVSQPKKSKPVKWQFGIRSRGCPADALLCIHRALHKLGASYLPDEDYDKVHAQECEDREPGAHGEDGNFEDQD